MMNKILRYTLAGLFAALSVFFLLPLTMGVRHMGVFFPILIFLIFIWMLLRPKQLWKLLTGKRRLLWRTVLALFAAGLVCVDVILGCMIRQALNRPEDDTPRTVLVLGCEVRGLQPSPMLANRIDSAYAYLSTHPDAVCVASGGMDDSEPITEAQCIRDTLVSMGIDPGRIYMEDRSRSTEENLAFSAELIRANGLSADVAIASDNFHQLRGAIWAERSGLTPYAIGCASPWFLTAGYWTRETAALLYMVVTGG